jgi:hypothetical protein
MRRPLSLLRPGLLAVALVAGGLLATASVTGAATIAPTTTCSNHVDTTPGLGLICQVTVVNTITPSGGSSRTTVRECHGAAGDPTAACATKVSSMKKLVTKVTQCNYSISSGGTLRCSVKVTNNFVGVSTGRSAATVNQCVGSGDGIANNCDPFPATTTGATITQCNNSANGGTLVRLECTATGTTSASNSVQINQCNHSANGGGSLVICSANLVNRILPAGSTVGGNTGGNASPTVPATNTTGQVVAQPAGTNPLILAAVLLLVALTLMAALRRFAPKRRHR